MDRPHYADGRECNCNQKWSASPSRYVANHPNKKGADGQTFNDELDASSKARSR